MTLEKALSDQRYSILGISVDLIGYDAAVATVLRWRDEGTRSYVVITNPHSVMTCRRDAEMLRATTGGGLTLPDGMGVIWAAGILGYPHLGRVTGPTLMLRLCDEGRQHGLRHLFYGGAEGVAEKLAERLTAKLPGLNVVGTHCPPFRPLKPDEDEQTVAMINAARPDIVWVGVGAPKQEKWMAAHVGRIEAPAMIGVGAAFDFHSGNVRLAPAWVRRLGLEWAYRLVSEPRRMWRRNVNGALFLLAALGQRFRGGRNLPNRR